MKPKTKECGEIWQKILSDAITIPIYTPRNHFSNHFKNTNRRI